MLQALLRPMKAKPANQSLLDLLEHTKAAEVALQPGPDLMGQAAAVERHDEALHLRCKRGERLE